MPFMARLPSTTPINLRRRFALTSLGVITVIALGLGWLMSHMLTQRMLQREGEVSMDFIQNLLLTDKSALYLSNPDDAELRERFRNSMAHLASMSEPVRANAYRTDGTVLWSTDKALIGRHYPVNDELDEALAIAAKHGCYPLRGVATYEDVYKLNVRGPSGIIVMLAEELQKA